MVEKPLLERKRDFLAQLVAEIRQYLPPNDADVLRHLVLKRFLERNLELAIDTMIDIAKHLVCDLKLRHPETYVETFLILSEAGIITAEQERIFASMVRLRNLLVHFYDRFDEKVMLSVCRERLTDFDVFVSITTRLCRDEPPNPHPRSVRETAHPYAVSRRKPSNSAQRPAPSASRRKKPSKQGGRGKS